MNGLLPTPAPDFSQPLELLHACHGRIEAQCVTMHKLAAHLETHGCDAESKVAAQAVLRYFNTAAVHHHEDEEIDLFPALLALVGDEERLRMSALLENLIGQHRDLASAWSAVSPWLESVANGEPASFARASLEGLLVLYRRHIELEETALLPYCRKVMDRPRREVLGRSMAARRGVALDGTNIH